MSTCLEPRELVQQDLLPRAHAWRAAVFAPLLLAVPWLMLCRFAQAPAEIATMRGLLLVLLLSAATVTDLLRRRIYNWTTYTALGWVVVLVLLSLVPWGETGFGAAMSAALGMLSWRDSLMGFATGFTILFVFYNVFHGGAGDLKLVAVLGALVGVNQVIEILIYCYVLAGVFAACLLVAAAGPKAIFAFVLRSMGFAGPLTAPSSRTRDCLKRRLPMAPFVAAGTLLALISC
jgi:prepilin peptidase CpaA